MNTIRRISDFLCLPSPMSEFERAYLTRMNRVAFGFFALHIPVFTLLALYNDTGWLLALGLTMLVLAGPAMTLWTWKSQRATSIIMGMASMFMGGLLVHFGQGPVQIEMHFYFFVLLALLAVFANPMVIVAAAVTVAAHHAVLWWLLPSSVFNYDAPFWVVGVHALFVVLESIAGCFIARGFHDNVIGLERKVVERTKALAERNRDMRMILDSVEQGFLTIDKHGVMSEERSAAVEELLGPLDGTESLVEVIRPHDGRAADWLAVGLDDVFGGIMPVETMIDQLPVRVQIDQRFLAFHYKPIWGAGELIALAVVISDITAQVEKEKLEGEMREMLAMIERISNDKAGFLEFFQEAETTIASLRSREDLDLAITRRLVHTLKGNAAIFGLNRVVETCHTIEDYIADTGVLPEAAAWTTLFGCWSTTRGNLRRIISDETHELSLDSDEYQALLLGILNAEPKEILAARVASWRLEPTSRRLERVAEQTRQLAIRLGKGKVTVLVEHDGLRTDPEHWAEFWAALTHVIRNAVDHGLEDPEDRLLAGKPESGQISLSTQVIGDKYVVKVADDGRGIDWERVKTLASERNLPHVTQDDLVNALFSDGFTTTTRVTDVSGRGIGMAAARAACETLRGAIELDSQKGVGTEIRFVFDVDAMAPTTIRLLRDHGVENPHQAWRAQAVPFTHGDFAESASLSTPRSNK